VIGQLAQKAIWSSVYKHNDKLWRLRIEIHAGNLQTSNVSDEEPAPGVTETGTVVEFTPLKDTFE
jgi:hypothetical protein